MRVLKSAALAALILAGCGGGGSDNPTEVSANPPAPAASPGSATSPPPVASPPAEPAPAPPVAQPPAAEPPAAETPPPPSPTISGQVVVRAFSTLITPAAGDQKAMGTREEDSSIAGVSQRPIFAPSVPADERTWPGEYEHFSGSFGSGPLPMVRIRTNWTTPQPGILELGSTLEAVHALRRAEPFRMSAGETYPLDHTLGEWRDGAWYAELLVMTESADTFRLCWNLWLPEVQRLACGKFDRITGDHRGIYIIDDSLATGSRAWETR